MSKYCLKRNYEFTPVNGIQLFAFSLLSIFIGSSSIFLATNKDIYLKRIDVLAESVATTTPDSTIQKINSTKEINSQDLEYKQNCFYNCNDEDLVTLLRIYWKNIDSYIYTGENTNTIEKKTYSGKVDNNYTLKSETKTFENKNVNIKSYSDGGLTYTISRYINDNDSLKKIYAISRDVEIQNNPINWFKSILTRNRITTQDGLYSYTLTSKYEYLNNIPTRVITKQEYLLVQNQVIGAALKNGLETVWVNYDGSLTKEKSVYGTYKIWIDTNGNPLKFEVQSYDCLCSGIYELSEFNKDNGLKSEFFLIDEEVEAYVLKHPEILQEELKRSRI